MPKPTQDQIDEELQKQDDEVYGTDYTDGGEKFHDTEDMVKEIIGNEPDPEQDGFELKEEIEKDDDAVEDGAGTPGYPGDVDEDDVESDMDKIESDDATSSKEKYKEDSSDE